MTTSVAPPPGLLARLLGEPWALPIAWLSKFADAIARGDMAAVPTSRSQPAPRLAPSQIAVIPIHGVIEQRASVFGDLFGGTSLDALRVSFREAMADPRVKAIVLDVDSPGGGVAGVTEMATEIRAARGGSKKIVAVVNTLAASAAYWLASQADELVASPSADVGSIGIVALHQDQSKALESEGITTTVIAAGPYKAEVTPFQPLSDDARAYLQEHADASYQTFISDVAKGRRVGIDQVRSQYGGGRILRASKALAAGMVDRVEPIDATIARLAREPAHLGMTAAAYVTAEAATSELPTLVAGPIGSHHTGTDAGAWDGPANEARLPSSEAALRKAHAWVDPDGDPDAKASYKFIHHEVSTDGTVGAANMTACSSAIAVLNGGRGGTTIPAGDMDGVHAHLAAHMADADREAPPMMGAAPFADRVAALAAEAASLVAHAETRATLRAKEGRPRFSTTTERSLRSIRESISALIDLDEPGDGAAAEQPVEPAAAAAPVVTAPPPAAPTPVRRFRSEQDWAAYLERISQR